jgi:hypothetical protein
MAWDNRVATDPGSTSGAELGGGWLVPHPSTWNLVNAASQCHGSALLTLRYAASQADWVKSQIKDPREAFGAKRRFLIVPMLNYVRTLLTDNLFTQPAGSKSSESSVHHTSKESLYLNEEATIHEK